MATGYLALLQQQMAQPTQAEQMLISGIKGAGEFQRARQQAALEQAKIYQQAGESALQYGQPEQAVDYMNRYRESLGSALGAQLPRIPVVGAPIMQQPAGPVPLGQPPLQPVEVGRRFDLPQTTRTIRSGLMLERPKPINLGGDVLYYPDTGEQVVNPFALSPEQRLKEIETRGRFGLEGRDTGKYGLQGRELAGQFGLQREQLEQAGAAQRAAEAAALRAQLAQDSANLRREMAMLSLNRDIGQRGAGAIENIISTLPPGVSLSPIDLGQGRTGYRATAPLAMSPRAASEMMGRVSNMARMQGFNVQSLGDENAISILPTGSVLPRQRPQKLITSEAGERVVDKPGVRPLPRQTRPPAAARISREERDDIDFSALTEVSLQFPNDRLPLVKKDFLQRVSRLKPADKERILKAYNESKARILNDMIRNKTRPSGISASIPIPTPSQGPSGPMINGQPPSGGDSFDRLMRAMDEAEQAKRGGR